jgi:hypothetical protein
MSVEAAIPETAAREFEIKSTLNKIQEKTKDSVLIKDERKEPEEEKANEVYSELMNKIGEVSAVAAGKASEDEHYLNFLQDMRHVAVVGQAFADDEIPFEVDRSYEGRRGDANDEIFAYKASNTVIDGQAYNVDLLIRPRRFETVQTKGAVETLLSRQQRMDLHLKPVHGNGSEVSIRLDPGSRVTFDLDLPSIEGVDLSEAGQEGGHHFRSNFKLSADEMAEVLTAINTKVQYGIMKSGRR